MENNARGALAARPLLDTVADRARFVDIGGALDRIVGGLRHGFSTLLCGARGSGKTSLMHMAKSDLEASGIAVALVSEGRLGRHHAVESLVELIVREVAAVLEASVETGESDVYESLERLGALVASSDRSIVVMLDSPEPSAAYPLFGTARDEVWATGITWLVACPESRRVVFTRPPADAFWEIVIDIPTPTTPEITEMLRRRGVSVTLPAQLATAGLTPRTILAAARENPASPQAGIAAALGRKEAARSLSSPALALLTAMESLGPVTAHDPQLASSLGWTRGRIAQVMSQLRDSGLVTADEDKTSGPGRPKLVYRLVAADDARVPGSRR